ncbi:MAG: YdcF family protein [Clostridia bacterium]|nr:YdcF family protein [Clostridia bacterium]MBO7319430.1 YdcF family protein [Clostridia bacterium]
MKIVSLLAPVAVGIASFAAAEIKASKGNATEAPDVLLILGCRVRGEEPEETLQMRIDAAAEYLKNNPSVIAIACGGIVHEDQYKSEAQAICESLVAQGVEIERIILEDKSTTTQENFRNAIEIMSKMNDSDMKVAILSSEHHLLRASLLAKKCGLKVSTVPAPSPKKLLFKNYAREFICFAEFLKG